MVPLLRQGQYFAAISAGVDQMMRLIDGEPLPPPDRNWQRQRPLHWNNLPLLVFGFLIISSVLRGLFGRPLGAALSAGGIGLLVLSDHAGAGAGAGGRRSGLACGAAVRR